MDEELESFKNECLAYINEMPTIPEEIGKVIDAAFDRQKELYKLNKIDYDEIIKFIEESRKAAKEKIESIDVREMYLEWIKELQRRIENGENIATAVKDTKVKTDNIVSAILEILKDMMEAIKSRQNVLMHNRGETDYMIENVIGNATKTYISGFLNNNGEIIDGIYRTQIELLKTRIQKLYEEKIMTPQAQFKKDIDMTGRGLPLGTQAENAKKIIQNMEEQRNGGEEQKTPPPLSDNVIF